MCTKCDVEKPASAFPLRKNGRPRRDCKACACARSRAYYILTKETKRDSPEFRARVAEYARQYRSRYPEKIRAYKAQTAEQEKRSRDARATRDIAWHLWKVVKYRAQMRGIEFTITKADLVVPECCPVLGIAMSRGPKNTPSNYSVDRIRPELGYVPGHVRVISLRANTLKRDASLEELRAPVRYVEGATISETAEPLGAVA